MITSEISTAQPDLRQVGLHPDYWYPLAWSRDLKRGKVLGVEFAGEPVVIARTESGELFALEDRCAHRQLPLSLGVMEKNCLRCCYHGWSYNAQGKVAKIPYLPRGMQAPRGVRQYPCREAYGLIYVFMGSPEAHAMAQFPEFAAGNSNDYRVMYFSRTVNCHYSFMHENLLDMNHQFLHRRLMGTIQPTLLQQSKGQTWVEAQYKFENVSNQQHLGADLLLAGEQKNPETANFDIMTIRTEYPYQTLKIQRPGSAEALINLWVCYVPVGADQRKHHSFGLLGIRRPKIPGLMTLFWPIMRYFAEAVFTEDRSAVEAEQRAYDQQGGDWNQEIFPVILDVRELLCRQGRSVKEMIS
ncbi:MAG: aromatic ring-hydroxylating dioxygenase subunit alpha [Cyanobacteria bacterium P01_H01_bin.15]